MLLLPQLLQEHQLAKRAQVPVQTESQIKSQSRIKLESIMTLIGRQVVVTHFLIQLNLTLI